MLQNLSISQRPQLPPDEGLFCTKSCLPVFKGDNSSFLKPKLWIIIFKLSCVCFSMWTFMCVCVNAPVDVSMGVCVQACRAQKTTLGAIPQTPSSLLFETGPLISLNLTKQTRVGSEWTSGIHLFLSPQHWESKHMPPHSAFYLGSRESNPDPYVCMAGTLLIEL